MRSVYTNLIVLALSLITVQLFAQPSNDECIDAIPLSDVSNWCSDVGGFSNVGATESPEESPNCFPNNQTSNDVWFSFTATGTVLNVSVVGNNSPNSPGGSLEDPQVAIYAGACGSLVEEECISDAFNINAVETFVSSIVPGDTYFLRVSARNGAIGTFQLCINNFNEVPEPSGDCNTGVILCDKSPFSVQFTTGVGNNPNEIAPDAGCNTGGCQIAESSSSWYKWTCDDPGSLVFTITPLNPIDDIDFVLYELPNGIDDCSGKFDIRCMASGENVGAPFAEWEPCTGATGLEFNDPDQSETCGCQTGDNNFLAEIQMTEGTSYALVINNFSNSGSGFSIEFDGTGTFLGPQAAFTTSESDNTTCVGDPLTFTDASTFIGDIVGWKWSFGQGATPTSASTEGPHSVSYDTPGLRTVVLEVESDRGCLVTEIAQIMVECCDDHFSVNANISDLDCPNDQTGAIDLTTASDYLPATFEWSSGQSSEDITGLGLGEYMVTIVDESTCDTVLNYAVAGPPPIILSPQITMPTCNGGTDGAITLEVTGGTPGYQYNWENTGFTNDNTLTDISQGDYTVTVRDQNGCEEEMIIEVRELELTLDPAVQAITPPSCTGFSDGSIQVVISNGLPPYQYDFNDGNGFGDENTLSNLSAGVYQVDVQDANLCTGSFTFNMEDPPPLVLDFDPINVSCFGESDASVTVIASGGVGGYSYNWNTGSTSETISQLPAGNYAVTVLDANNCEIQSAITITEPNPLFIDLGEVIDVICNGEATGSITVIGSGGTTPYEYTLDGATFQSSNTFDNLLAGTYEISVVDAMGCSVSLEATITEPPPLVVNAGPDQLIDLGFSTDITATVSEFPVTFEWMPADFLSCMDCIDPEVIMPPNTITYTITVTNPDGCTATDDITITVIKNRPIYIPNAFSPNDDGINDAFTLYGGPAAREIVDIKIFNRWGGLVFERQNIALNDEALGWDGLFKGQPVNPGVFTFFAEVQFIDEEIVLLEGDVTVVR